MDISGIADGWRIIALCLLGDIALAAERDESLAALRICMNEPDDHLRLSCYDREMARLSAAAEKSFGLTAEQRRKLTPPAPAAATPSATPPAKPTPELMSSTVVTLSVRADGRSVIELANGAVWVQGEAYEPLNLRPGESVTIRPGLLGSYYLYRPSGERTRVTRAR